MQVEKLRAAVSELEQELAELETVDSETRQVLREAIQEIRAALDEDRPSGSGRHSLIERLNDAVQRFEGSHPALTNVVSRLIDVLGQMGI